MVTSQEVGSSGGALLSGTPKVKVATSPRGRMQPESLLDSLAGGDLGRGSGITHCPALIHTQDVLGCCCGERGGGQAARGRSSGLLLSPDGKA